MNSDGSNQQPLLENDARNTHPSWSPDGNKIAYASNVEGNWDIWIIELDPPSGTIDETIEDIREIIQNLPDDALKNPKNKGQLLGNLQRVQNQIERKNYNWAINKLQNLKAKCNRMVIDPDARNELLGYIDWLIYLLEDNDEDGIINEYEIEFGGDPNKQDIFVEVDWMGAGDSCSSHEPVDENNDGTWDFTEDVIQAFDNHNIILHIDDGSMGGGSEVPHSVGDSYEWVKEVPGDLNDFNDYYNNYFSSERRGIFHYCIFAHDITVNGVEYGGIANTGNPGHFSISDVANDEYKQEKYFMHELGHTASSQN